MSSSHRRRRTSKDPPFSIIAGGPVQWGRIKNKSASVLVAFVGEKDVVQSRVGRYKRTAKTYLENVCDGRLV